MQAELARLLGAEHVLDAPPDSPYNADLARRRGLVGRADAVALPGSAQQVADVVRWCYAHDVAIVPRGGGTGLLGGAVVAIVVAVVVVHFIHPWTLSKAALYGVVVAIVAPLGDLSQSMIKRHLGLKDMGRLLPGHGGILDRVDGLLFVMPATYFVVKAMHLG